MKPKEKRQHRLNRHKRVRAKIKGSSKKPRVAVFKSNKHIFVQIIDDMTGKTIASSKVIPIGKSKIKGKKTEIAQQIGEKVAEKMKELGITEAVFDRGGFKFHGRIKAVADGLKKGGIKI